jgi:ectoine hydroxylase-related dioxygenase (phytanoyl-CoA dioxygenase family)
MGQLVLPDDRFKLWNALMPMKESNGGTPVVARMTKWVKRAAQRVEQWIVLDDN